MNSRDGDRDNSAIQLSSLSNNVNMVAISLAIFTFLLFFSNSASPSQVHSLSFEASLGLVIAAVFSFGVAGLYNFVLVYSAPARHVKMRSHQQRAEVFFGLGLAILLLEPSLILFTLDFLILALMSLVFFFGYMILYLYETRTIHTLRGI